MKQAIVVASVCEFGGAVLLGSGVTDTIKSGIAKVSAYAYEPELLMYGMVCALLACGIWLALATFLELPVSTTHSIVGAIIGMSLVAAGGDSIIWYSAPKPGSPFPGGVVSIILAWFITPAMAAVVASLLFLFTKIVVLKAPNPFRRSLLLFPLYTFITIWVITYFVIQKGVNGWMKPKTYSTTSPVTAPVQPSCPPAGSGGSYKNSTSGGNIKISLTGCQIADGENAWTLRLLLPSSLSSALLA
jgi:solute carrier family 20 (sodium-dependent phosphate transporter)